MTSMNQLLDKLLLETKTLTATLPSNGMPMLQRNLMQLDAASRKQLKTKAKIDPFLEQKAASLLAEGGLDPSEHNLSLQRIDVTSVFEPLVNLADEDVDRFLAHQYQMLIGTAVEESSRLSNFTFRRQCVSSLEQDWENTKRHILEQHGQRLDQKHLIFNNTSSVHSQNALVLSGNTNNIDMSMSETHNNNQNSTIGNSGQEPQLQYEQVITQLNKHKLHDQVFPLIDAFIDVEQNNFDNDELLELWCILAEMIKDKQQVNNDMKYEKITYTEQSLLKGAIRYSEEEYYAYMKDVCASKPHIARIGGNPTALHHVKGFLNVVSRAGNDNYSNSNNNKDNKVDMSNGYPLWSLVYYCLRSGQKEDAVNICNTAVEDGLSNMETFRDALVSLLEYQSNGESGLDQSIWKKLNQEYDSYVSNEVSQPYKIALYHIVGRFTVNEKHIDIYKNVFKSTEDYIWQKLNLIWNGNRPLPDWLGRSASSTLVEFQNSVTEHGPAYFNPTGDDPIRYFKILLLSLQFDAAIFYITATNNPKFFSFGLHYAFTLRYYNLLDYKRTTSGSNSYLKTDQKTIDFDFLVHKIWYFLEPIYRAHPSVAFHYILLLHDNNYQQEFEQQMIKLLWLCKEFTILIGSKKKNVLQRGLLYTYLSMEEANRIIHYTGQKARQLGAFEEAITIYTLARASEDVGEILIDQLSDTVHAPPTHPQKRWLLEQARTLLKEMCEEENNKHNMNSSRTQVMRSLTYLHDFGNFFELCHQGRYDEAERIIMNLELITFNPQDLSSKNEENFRNLDDRIKKVMKFVVKYLMNIYMKKRDFITQSYGVSSIRFSQRGGNNGREKDSQGQQALYELRNKVDALINFVTKHQVIMGNLHHELLRISASF